MSRLVNLTETQAVRLNRNAVRAALFTRFSVSPLMADNLETYFLLVWQAKYLRKVLENITDGTMEYDGKKFAIVWCNGFGPGALHNLAENATVAVSFREAWPQYELPAVVMIKEWHA